MCVPRRGHVAVLHKLQVFVIGGYCEALGGVLASVEVFDLATGWWREAPPMPTPRCDLAGAACLGRIFALGGRGGGRLHSTAESCDAESKQWDSHVPMYRARSGLGAAACGSFVFAVGGGFNTHGSIEATTLVEYFDANIGSWADAPPMRERRCDAGVVSHGWQIIVAGGTSTSGSSRSVEIFDIGEWAWQSGPSMNYARSGLGAAVQEGQIFVLGGPFAGVKPTTMEVLDLKAQPLTWKACTPLTRNCWGPQLVAYAGAEMRQFLKQEDRKVTARYALMEAIAIRDASRLTAAIEEGESVGLATNELFVGQSMLKQYEKDGFIIGFDATLPLVDHQRVSPAFPEVAA